MDYEDRPKTGPVELGLSLVLAGIATWLLLGPGNNNGRVLFPILFSLLLIWEPKYFVNFLPGNGSPKTPRLIGWAALLAMASLSAIYFL